MKHSHPIIRQQKATREKTWPRAIIEEDQGEPIQEEMPRKPAPKPLIKRPAIPSVELDVTGIVVNFNTKFLVKQAVQTFRKFYPSVPLIIIDNASRDGSAEWIRARENDLARVVVNNKNYGHGPALDAGIMLCTTRYAFTFDSDIRFHHGGFLQLMQRAIDGKYAIGWLRWVNHNGVAARGHIDKARLCPYVHPCFALFDVEIYKQLKPFVNKGAPCVDNMYDARKKGYSVGAFPFERYADHLIAGTRRLYMGHWWAKDEKPRQQWNPDAKIPI